VNVFVTGGTGFVGAHLVRALQERGDRVTCLVRRPELAERLGWRDDVPVIGFLGRLVPQKGVKFLTELLDRSSTPWRALIVGSGPLESALRVWARRYPGRVAIETAVRHDEVPRWLNAMDVLAAPSQTTAKWREQFGRMLIEAFACGIPVIASDSGEIPHVVGDAGLVIAEKDRAEWDRSLGRLLTDERLRRDLASRGRQRAVSVYDWAVVAQQHTRFFRLLIEGASPERARIA